LYIGFLDKQESMNSERGNYLQLKEDLLSKETNLFQAQSMIDQLQKEIEQTREEVFKYPFTFQFIACLFR
jgi:hypothetical protein